MQFSKIPGQEEVKKKLILTVKENRVSHTQMFTGPPSSGKLALAIAFAQYLNCSRKEINDDDSCGVCPSCVKYEKLIHPDLHFVYPLAPTTKFPKPLSRDFLEDWRNYLSEINYFPILSEWYDKIGIENKQAIINVRDCEDILAKLSLKAYEGPYKIVVMWMVEKLFHAAAPKILKILEEPPDQSLFILITENPEQILSTIISRCQITNIPKIKTDILYRILSENTEHTQALIRKA